MQGYGKKGFPEECLVRNAAFHMQQAVERILEAVCLYHGKDIEYDYDIKKLIASSEGTRLLEGYDKEELKEIAGPLASWKECGYNLQTKPSKQIYDKAKNFYCFLFTRLIKESEIVIEDRKVPGWENKEYHDER